MLNKKQLLEQLLQMKHPQKLLEKLVVIRALLLKYGKKLTLPRFLEGIKNGDADTACMIDLLEQAKLLHLPKLSAFIREFQEKLPREHLQFRLLLWQPILKKSLERLRWRLIHLPQRI